MYSILNVGCTIGYCIIGVGSGRVMLICVYLKLSETKFCRDENT